MTTIDSTRTGTVPVEGGELWFEVAGPATPDATAVGPDVVLAHPGTMDSRIWDDAFADLTRDHRVVRFDARGHGRSASTAGDHSGHEDMLAVLDHVGSDRPVIVGNSLGGRNAVDLALEHPDRVAGLVLVGPGLSGYEMRHDGLTWQHQVEHAGYLALAAAQQGRDPAAEVAELIETILRGEVDGSHRTPDQVDPALRAELAEIVRTTVMTHYTNHGELVGVNAIDRLGELTVPVLAMVGSLDFRDILEIVDLVAAQAPNARTVVVDGVGHMVQNEVPDLFVHQVRAFLAEVVASGSR